MAVLERAIELWLSSYAPPRHVRVQGCKIIRTVGNACTAVFGLRCNPLAKDDLSPPIEKVSRDIHRMAFDLYVGRGILVIPRIEVVN